MKSAASFIALILLTYVTIPGLAQTIFSVMQDPLKQANKLYEKGDLPGAIRLYKNAIADGIQTDVAWTNLARAQYRTRDYIGSVNTYQAFASGAHKEMKMEDLLLMADAQIILNHHQAARASLKKYLEKDPANDLVAKKLWRLDNLKFMYEDSSHFAVRYLPINTDAAELGATLLKNQLVFTSNRKGKRPIDQTSQNESVSFFHLFAVETRHDSSATYIDTKAEWFLPQLQTPYHNGPIVFYDSCRKVAFVASSSKTDANGYRHLGLFFSNLEGDSWKPAEAFPYNDENHSIKDVTINEEGTILYFSSNMKHGFGGHDIYQSKYINGTWSKPVNAGEQINTAADETFPFIYRDATLYFSSNGQPGMGGFDIFKSAILDHSYSEPENLGYPLNSSHDDFSFSLDSTAAHGYFTSNRKNGGYDDDIYEFDMDMQAYPFQITGTLLVKEHTWSDPLNKQAWPRAKLSLVDSWHETTISSITTGADGSFTLSIPYFSRYHILVTGEDSTKYVAGLELEKYRKDTNSYEVVIVKDIFNNTEHK